MIKMYTPAMLSRTVKLRLNRTQGAAMNHLSCAISQLYNELLQINIDRLDSGQKTLRAFEMSKLCLTENLQRGIGSDILQALCNRLDIHLRHWQDSERLKLWFRLRFGEGYKKPLQKHLFKRRTKLWGKPRFKAQGTSIQYPVRKTGQAKVRVFGTRTSIHIPLIGRVQGYNDRQALLGEIKHISLKKDSCGQWWAKILCSGNMPQEIIRSRSKSIGVDLGLKHAFTAANDSEVIQTGRTRFLESKLSALGKASRNKSRGYPFIHRKAARRRKHYHHVQARKLLLAADNIFVGGLSSKFLLGGNLARSASDAGHSQFLSILSYKASNAGKTVKIVDEAYTSQTCYKCGNRKKMSLLNRHYLCVCGYSNDRDVNSALNILLIGEKSHLVA